MDFVQRIHDFNQQAGLLDKPYDDFLESSFQIEEALEGFEFDGMGNGKTLYRAEDHQCFKDVLVMKGKENPTNQYDTLEIVESTPVEQVLYAPNLPMFGGDDATLGTCYAG